MSSLTRGPLSAGVYWRRRLVALLVALSLVVMIGGLLTGGSDGSSDSATPTAEQAAAGPSTGAPPQAAESLSPAERKARRQERRKARRQAGKKAQQEAASPSPTPLAAPDGPCVDSDLTVTPVVKKAVAGGDVRIVLRLRTNVAEACTWRVSADHVTLKITSGEDDVWSSLDCPGPVPARDVVVRREVTSTVGLVWRGKRSDDTCSGLTDWALPGTYTITAAAFGGEPTETSFELTLPEPEVIESTPESKPGSKGKKKNKKPR